LASAYAKDRSAAEGKYKGKQLSVSGMLDNVVEGVDRRPELCDLHFQGVVGEGRPLGIKFRVNLKTLPPGTSFNVAQQLRVIGECTGISEDDIVIRPR